MTLQRWLRRVRGLTTGETRLLAEAQIALAVSQVARWRRPTGRLLSLVPELAGSADGEQRRSAARVGWAVDRAARYGLFRPKCLVRSLAVQRMLRRRGIACSQLRIGVRVEAGELLAHAWVELDGAVVGDSLQYVRRFTPATDFRFVQL